MKCILEINNLDVCFPSKLGRTYAVQDVEIRLERGEILGVVGESGAGKSTVGNAIINLLEPPGRITRGKIIFDGKNIENLTDTVYFPHAHSTHPVSYTHLTLPTTPYV